MYVRDNDRRKFIEELIQMTFIETVAKELNKPASEVIKLCEQKQIEVHYDQDGIWIYDDQAKQLLKQEFEKPTRYNFRGIECTAVQRVLIGDDNMQKFWIGNVIKYIYRAGSIGDLKKARVYLDMIIDDAENVGIRY